MGNITSSKGTQRIFFSTFRLDGNFFLNYWLKVKLVHLNYASSKELDIQMKKIHANNLVIFLVHQKLRLIAFFWLFSSNYAIDWTSKPWDKRKEMQLLLICMVVYSTGKTDNPIQPFPTHTSYWLVRVNPFKFVFKRVYFLLFNPTHIKTGLTTG